VSHNDRDWLDVYRAAVMEFDRDKLPASIDVAEKAIHQRLRGLPIANSKEHRELRDALNSLTVLKRMLEHMAWLKHFLSGLKSNYCRPRSCISGKASYAALS